MRAATVVIGSLALAGLLSTRVTAQSPIVDSWEGAISVMGGELGIRVTFELEAEELAATIDIPQQNARGLPLRAVSFDAPRVHFELPAGPGLAVFDGELTGDRIEGDFSQAGVTGTFRLERANGAAEPTDEGGDSVPYRTEEVRFRNGSVELAGTLTLPDGPGPHPGAAFITGSGPQNRDEELFGFRPFRIIADHLTRRGIATLRFDDRGVGGSTGDIFEATAEDYAGDALAAVRTLGDRPAVDPDRVGLLGHSEGAIVASMAAARSDDVAFVVLLAGTAVPGARILVEQGERIARANGASASAIERQTEFQRRLFDALRTDEGWDEVRASLETMIRAGVDSMTAEQRGSIRDVDAYVRSAVESQLANVRSPWFRHFLDHDPASALRRVDVPVLALFGELDLQVPPEVNREPMAEALADAGNGDVTIRVLPNANHLFIPAETGSPAEYGRLEKRFVPGFLELIGEWIGERFVETGEG